MDLDKSHQSTTALEFPCKIQSSYYKLPPLQLRTGEYSGAIRAKTMQSFLFVCTVTSKLLTFNIYPYDILREIFAPD